MTEELYFDIELKKCLNTAAFSDDLWDWWYQRLHQAHDASVDRVTDAQRVENTKLRELAAGIGHLLCSLDVDYCSACPRDSINHPCPVYAVGGGECPYKTDLHDLGVEVD